MAQKEGRPTDAMLFELACITIARLADFAWPTAAFLGANDGSGEPAPSDDNPKHRHSYGPTGHCTTLVNGVVCGVQSRAAKKGQTVIPGSGAQP
jgi:hypothetical protein